MQLLLQTMPLTLSPLQSLPPLEGDGLVQALTDLSTPIPPIIGVHLQAEQSMEPQEDHDPSVICN